MTKIIKEAEEKKDADSGNSLPGLHKDMTYEERTIKRQLRELLVQDGYPKYAARLKAFTINIYPTNSKIIRTAAMYFDKTTICINRGFIKDMDSKIFSQLSVLIRHELLHAILMHQIRMTKKLGDERFLRTHYSALFAHLENIVADDEISNRGYTNEDKTTVRNMMLNGEVIGGLVTEDHRPTWMRLSLEQMYDEILTEVNEASTTLIQMLENGIEPITYENKDIIKNTLLNPEYQAFIYKDTVSPSSIKRPLADFITKNRAFKNFPEHFKKIVQSIATIIGSAAPISYTDEQIKENIAEIAATKPTETFDLTSKETGEFITDLITPEEKAIAVDILKRILQDRHLYDEWFNKVKQVMADPKYSDQDLQDLLDHLSK